MGDGSGLGEARVPEVNVRALAKKCSFTVWIYRLDDGFGSEATIEINALISSGVAQ